jgi:hypothetical protein
VPIFAPLPVVDEVVPACFVDFAALGVPDEVDDPEALLEVDELCEPLDGVCCALSVAAAKQPAKNTTAICVVVLVMKLVSHCRASFAKRSAPRCNHTEMFAAA